MDGTRLDQLKFPDETKVGLALFMAYMLFDVTQSFTFGGSQLAPWIGLPLSDTAVGWFQLGMLVTLLASYAVWRQRRVRTQFGLRDLSSTDAALADDADYLARHIAGGRGRFFVTSNFNDCNAFCMPGGKGGWIVLGAGLRVQFRKQRERVRAVLAHECSHADSGDVGYVVFAWYMFRAYAALAVVNLLITQGRFWFRVPEVLSSFDGILGLILFNAHYFFEAGFSGLLAVVALWFVLRHFILLREFRADERAAQFGFRPALIDAIRSLQYNAAGRPWQRIVTLHPTAGQRIDRLTSQEPWARLDTLFLGAMAFLATRIEELVFLIQDTSSVMQYADTSNDPFVMIEHFFEAEALRAFVIIAVSLALVFMMLLHVYRVAVTQTADGATWTSRLAMLWPTCIATFAGTFLGQATSWSQLTGVTRASVDWTLINALDDTLGKAALAVLVTWFFTVAIVALAPRPLQRAPRSWRMQTLWMIASTLLAAFAIQVAMNLIGIAIVFLFGHFPAWEIEGMPYSTRQDIAGLPSLLQIALILLVLSLLLTLPRRYVRRSTLPVLTVDPTWYVRS